MKMRSDSLAGLLEGDQVELGIELGELLSGCPAWRSVMPVRGVKKVGQAHFSILRRDEKACSSV